MFNLWSRREENHVPWWKILIVTGLVGVGVAAEVLRRRSRLRIRRPEFKISRRGATLRLRAHTGPRDGRGWRAGATATVRRLARARGAHP